MKPYSAFLFFASFLLVFSLLFGAYGCTPQSQKKAEPPKQAKATPPAVNPNAPISVDFDNMPLSQVAQFVTARTGQGFILSGNESKPVSWIEYRIPKEKILDSFRAALSASNLMLTPANDAQTLFTIEQQPDEQVPYQLNFATSEKGTWFLLGSTIYTMDGFPWPLKRADGHWFAMLPKSLVDQLEKVN